MKTIVKLIFTIIEKGYRYTMIFAVILFLCLVYLFLVGKYPEINLPFVTNFLEENIKWVLFGILFFSVFGIGGWLGKREETRKKRYYFKKLEKLNSEKLDLSQQENFEKWVIKLAPILKFFNIYYEPFMENYSIICDPRWIKRKESAFIKMKSIAKMATEELEDELGFKNHANTNSSHSHT